MTNENAKLHELLEWIKYGHIKQQHQDVRDGEVEDFIPVKDLMCKINNLFPEATPEESSTVAETATVDPWCYDINSIYKFGFKFREDFLVCYYCPQR